MDEGDCYEGAISDDGTQTPMTIPNHPTIKGSTLRTMLTQSGISRDEFLTVFERIW